MFFLISALYSKTFSVHKMMFKFSIKFNPPNYKKKLVRLLDQVPIFVLRLVCMALNLGFCCCGSLKSLYCNGIVQFWLIGILWSIGHWPVKSYLRISGNSLINLESRIIHSCCTVFSHVCLATQTMLFNVLSLCSGICQIHFTWLWLETSVFTKTELPKPGVLSYSTNVL